MAELNYTKTKLWALDILVIIRVILNMAIALDQDLLGAGWQPLHRELDWGYLFKIVQNDPKELSHKAVDLASDLADALSRNDYSW